jgi:large subunit ribosomal protein L31
MQPNIHPNYHEVTIELTSGKNFKTRSSYGKPGAVIKLEIDPENHPAWTGGTASANQNADKVANFNRRFAGVDLSAIVSGKKA